MARKQNEELMLPDEIEEAVRGLNLPDRLLEGGEPNPDYPRAVASKWQEILLAAASQGKSIPNGKSMFDGLKSIAEMHGFNPKNLADVRTDAQVFEDAVNSLIERGDSAFEMADSTVKLLEEGFAKALNGCIARIDEETEKAKAAGANPYPKKDLDRIRGKKKALENWIEVLKRVMEIRQVARKPVLTTYEPPLASARWVSATHEERRWAMEASHVLRFMLYVGRSNIPGAAYQKRHNIFYMTEHLCRMATAVWEAENGVYFTNQGPQKGVIQYEGVLIAAPPGHWKSELSNHVVGLWLCKNPREQVKIGHAKPDNASSVLQYAAAMFREDEPVGRRRATLYPAARMAKKDDTKRSMRLELPVTQKAPTLTSNGVHEAIGGHNASRIVYDDVVDQDEMWSTSDRDRTTAVIRDTWMNRLRGNPGIDSFWMSVTTIWHEDDFNSRMIDAARKGKKIVKVLMLPAGGPEDNFKPVCEHCADRAKLRSKWQEDSSAYNTVYRMLPTPDQGRIVNKVGLYDSDSPEHREFMDNCFAVHCSVDPTATTKPRSDKAGVVFAAHGDKQVVNEDGNTQTVTQLRVFKADRLAATPLDICHMIVAYAHDNRLDGVTIETQGGYSTMAEYLDAYAGIETNMMDPTHQGKKGVRLRQVANLLDASRPQGGMSVPVLLPGVRNENGNLVPRSDIQWLVDEIEKFGSAKTDDGLDALVQLVRHLRDELTVGPGVVTEAVREAVKGNPRMKAEMERALASMMKVDEENVWENDIRFMQGMAPARGYSPAWN